MPITPEELSTSQRVKYYLSNQVIRGITASLSLLPYPQRIAMMGRLVRFLGPVVGYHKRIRTNLTLIQPELSEQEVKNLCRKVCDNVGRSFGEFFAGQPFWDRAKQAKITGPGFEPFKKAHAEGRPIMIVTAHFGNYDAARSKLIQEGYNLGPLYRRMANPYFNADYVKSLNATGTPTFEQGKKGMVEMVRYLKKGGTIAIVTDLHAIGGTYIDFMGHPASTSLVPAELALKYNALMVPIYAVRQDNGLDFEIVMKEPVPHSDALEMTTHLCRDLEQKIQTHKDQWFWIHRRWK